MGVVCFQGVDDDGEHEDDPAPAPAAAAAPEPRATEGNEPAAMLLASGQTLASVLPPGGTQRTCTNDLHLWHIENRRDTQGEVEKRQVFLFGPLCLHAPACGLCTGMFTGCV